jgi:hypothetical protein
LGFSKLLAGLSQLRIELAEPEVHVFVIALTEVEIPENSLGGSDVWRWCFVNCVIVIDVAANVVLTPRRIV